MARSGKTKAELLDEISVLRARLAEQERTCVHLKQVIEEISSGEAPAREEPHPGIVEEEHVPGETTESFQKLQEAYEELQVAEEELRQQNEELIITREMVEGERLQYRDLFDSAPDGYLVTDAHGVIIDANHMVEAMFNFPREALCGKPLTLFIAKEQQKDLMSRLIELEEPKSGKWELLIRLDERVQFPVEVSLTKAPKSGNFRWLIRDIAERKRAETELKRIAQKYSTLFNSTSDGVWIQDLKGEILEVNEAYCRMSGYAPGELTRMSVSALEAVESPEEISNHIRRVLKAGGHDRFESRHRRKDGSLFDVDVTALYFEEDSGRMAIFVRDITERKQAEEALRKANERVALILNSINDGFFSLDNNLVMTYVNKAAERILNRKAEEIVGRPFLEAFPEAEGSIFEEKYTLAVKSKISLSFEAFFDVPPYVNWYSVRVFPFENGISVYFLATTEQKQAEQEMRENRRDLNRAQAVAHVGSWRLDVRENELSWSDQTYRMFGIPLGTALTYETFLGIVHPDDREYVAAKWTAALRGEPYDIEHRIVVDDTIRWVRERAELEFDEKGGLLGGFGTVQDITDRKESEDEIHRTMEKLNAANEELQRFNRAMVGRELRMIELKKEVNELLVQAGEPPRYRLDFEKEERENGR